MSLSFYMDENIERAITVALRMRRIDVRTAQEDGRANTPDNIVFDRAIELDRVLVSEDVDMLIEATLRLRSGGEFAGVVFWRQRSLSLGAIIRDLELLGIAGTAEDVRSRITFLPL